LARRGGGHGAGTSESCGADEAADASEHGSTGGVSRARSLETTGGSCPASPAEKNVRIARGRNPAGTARPDVLLDDPRQAEALAGRVVGGRRRAGRSWVRGNWKRGKAVPQSCRVVDTRGLDDPHQAEASDRHAAEGGGGAQGAR
jgi:hypothetical protein